MSRKLKLCLLYLCSLTASITPTLIYFFINYDRYTESIESRMKLLAGGIIALFFIIMKVLVKLKMPPRSVFFAIICILSYLLEPIIDDLLIFSLLAFIGEMLDLIVNIPIKKIREEEKVDRVSEITAIKVEETLKKYYRGSI